MQNIFDSIVSRLSVFDPEQIILFGSWARGTADEKSDMDLLVIMPVNGNRRKMVLEMDRSLKGLGLARDIVILTRDEFETDREIPGTIARPAWLEGKLLYEKH
ncbi:MAG: nucleotidyltransferase domain-containing protein [Candidatus Wallbacteria bacterium]|nr:nucleotidyltransferase domain-containing protein [Candidatus Wallbacteria bacterium]